jgi:hypothetical protein
MFNIITHDIDLCLLKPLENFLGIWSMVRSSKPLESSRRPPRKESLGPGHVSDDKFEEYRDELRASGIFWKRRHQIISLRISSGRLRNSIEVTIVI